MSDPKMIRVTGRDHAELKKMADNCHVSIGVMVHRLLMDRRDSFQPNKESVDAQDLLAEIKRMCSNTNISVKLAIAMLLVQVRNRNREYDSYHSRKGEH